MKKYQIILLIAFGIVFTLWAVGRLTNSFQYLKSQTKSNEPTYKSGTYFLASNLITPKRFDFICYEVNEPDIEKQMWFHRICGMPGDTLEVRNGDLFVNGINQDLSLNLKKEYDIPFQLATALDFEEGDAIRIPGTDSIYVLLETINHKDLIQQAKRHKDRDEGDPMIQKIYGQPWTANNFGPYIVPADAYFVMGDNRNRSQDSRYLGPVKKDKMVATVIR
jgi:signal peptidase I